MSWSCGDIISIRQTSSARGGNVIALRASMNATDWAARDREQFFCRVENHLVREMRTQTGLADGIANDRIDAIAANSDNLFANGIDVACDGRVSACIRLLRPPREDRIVSGVEPVPVRQRRAQRFAMIGSAKRHDRSDSRYRGEAV
jgi:hypothetical protein